MSRMKRTDELDRYFECAMSASEEREFLDRVMKDPILREAVETEQIIESTLRKDREAVEHDESKMKAHVLGLLASIRVADGFSGSSGAGAHSTSVSSGSPLLATGAAKIISTVIVTLGLSTGAYFLAQNSSTGTNGHDRPDLHMQAPHENVSSPKIDRSTDAEQGIDQQEVSARLLESSGTIDKQKSDERKIFSPQLNPKATQRSERNASESLMKDSLQMKLKVDLNKVKRLHDNQE